MSDTNLTQVFEIDNVEARESSSAQELAKALESRGWEVSVVKAAEVTDLVDTNSEGLMKCVDGRLSDKPDQMRGPKTLGGVYSLVASRGQTDIASFKAAVKEIKAAGFVPSVHGDDHHQSMGCGFLKLWTTGQLEGLAKPDFTPEEGKAVVLANGGVYETLSGAHQEEQVMINLVENTTLEPNEIRFIVDAWIADKFNLDLAAYANRAAETVEKLNGPKKAVIITK